MRLCTFLDSDRVVTDEHDKSHRGWLDMTSYEAGHKSVLHMLVALLFGMCIPIGHNWYQVIGEQEGVCQPITRPKKDDRQPLL